MKFYKILLGVLLGLNLLANWNVALASRNYITPDLSEAQSAAEFEDLTEDGTTIEHDLKRILNQIFKTGRNLLAPIGLLLLIYGGIRLATSQNEEGAKKAQEIIVDTAIALVVVTAAPLLLNIFYFGNDNATIADSPQVVEPWNNSVYGSAGTQLLKITNFVMLILIPIFIGVICFYGAMFIFSLGDQEWLKKKRRDLYWSAIGLVVVLLARTGVEIFLKSGESTGVYSPSMEQALTEYVGFINFFLYLVGALAVVVVIYCGYNIILAGDNEEAVAKNKRQVLYVMIALALIISSYVIVQTFLPADAIVLPLPEGTLGTTP